MHRGGAPRVDLPYQRPSPRLPSGPRSPSASRLTIFDSPVPNGPPSKNHEPLLSAMTNDTFACYLVTKDEAGHVHTRIAEKKIDELPPGDVLIRVAYSSLNYKDALSATGHPGVTRKYPHIPGIDAAGTVAHSSVANFREGDQVLVTGYDLGQNTWGGFSEYVRVPAGWVVPLPPGLSLRESMIYGTAGFTAAQSVDALVHRGITLEARRSRRHRRDRRRGQPGRGDVGQAGLPGGGFDWQDHGHRLPGHARRGQGRSAERRTRRERKAPAGASLGRRRRHRRWNHTGHAGPLLESCGLRGRLRSGWWRAGATDRLPLLVARRGSGGHRFGRVPAGEASRTLATNGYDLEARLPGQGRHGSGPRRTWARGSRRFWPDVSQEESW